MRANELITLYDYYCWATKKILAQAAQVTPEQWAGPPPIGTWGLREPFARMLGTEQGWRNAWGGRRNPTPVSPPTSRMPRRSPRAGRRTKPRCAPTSAR